VTGPEGPERQERPCICADKGTLECEYKLRLSVIMPEARSLGTWRLDTSSENAQAEIPGMVDIIEASQQQGLHWAVLRLEHRTSPGRRFVVPVLDIDHTMQELVDGATRLTALPSTAPALGVAPDDEVIEGEIVEDVITGEHPVAHDMVQAWLAALTTHQRKQALLRARELAVELGEEQPLRADDINDRMLDRLMQEALNGATP
jgi:hypothetical protein